MLDALLWPFYNLPERYIAIDTETTGLFHQGVPPDMVSLGLCVVVDREVISTIEYRIKPEKPYSDDSELIHGFEWNQAQNHPELRESWSDIVSVIDGELVVAHNASFDWRVLSAAALRGGLMLPQVRGVFCSQRAAQPWSQANNIKCSERGASLSSLMVALGLDIQRSEGRGLHSAKRDAYILALLVEKLRLRAGNRWLSSNHY